MVPDLMALLNKWAFRTSVVSSGVLRSDIERRLRGRSGLDGEADEADEYAPCCSLVTYRRTLGRTGREGVMGIIVISEQERLWEKDFGRPYRLAHPR